jgi:hypothetical protein
MRIFPLRWIYAAVDNQQLMSTDSLPFVPAAR